VGNTVAVRRLRNGWRGLECERYGSGGLPTIGKLFWGSSQGFIGTWEVSKVAQVMCQSFVGGQPGDLDH
jgi:hypothetical protein